VVAANEGWKPQSAEHLAILDVLGTNKGVVALTKIDLVDPSTLESIRTDVAARLQPSSLKDLPIVACSAVTGEGIDELVDTLDRAVSTAPPAPNEGRPRLWVDRVFTIAGAGTVVTGTLGGGGLAVGDDIALAPDGRRARVRSIQSHKKEVTDVSPGNRTALNLAGLERQGAKRGDAVVKPGHWHATRRVHAFVQVLDPGISGQHHELKEKGAHLLYAGTAETPVRIRLISSDRIAPGSQGFAQLELRDPLPLGRGDRFVLREAGRIVTLGGGRILDPWPARGPRDPELAGYLESIRDSDPRSTLELLVQAEGAVDAEQGFLRTGAGAGDGVAVLGATLVSSSKLEELSSALQEEVRRYHTEQTLRRGMDREELRAKLGVEDRSLFDALIEAVPGITQEGPLVRMQDHAVALSGVQEAERDRLLARLESDGLNPPLTKELDVSPALLRALSESGEIVPIGNFFLTAEQVRNVRASVVAFIERNGPATVAQLRDELQTSRKYAVPLCEWLDQNGVTRRQGNDRVLGPRAFE
jgi:selenocysteine-specific elongation factor